MKLARRLRRMPVPLAERLRAIPIDPLEVEDGILLANLYQPPISNQDWIRLEVKITPNKAPAVDAARSTRRRHQHRTDSAPTELERRVLTVRRALQSLNGAVGQAADEKQELREVLDLLEAKLIIANLKRAKHHTTSSGLPSGKSTMDSD